MDILESKLQNQSAGKLLDTATGCGNFIRHLQKAFKDIDLAIGVDISDSHIEEWQEAFKNQNAIFIKMDCNRLAFPDATFDTVSMAYSLHHLSDINAALSEMLRVLKPGGRVIIVDVYRDVKEKKRLSHVCAHHFHARVDRAHGIFHNETLIRQEIVDHTEILNLRDYEFFDFDFNESLYDSREQAESWIKVIDKDITRMESNPDYHKFKKEGEDIIGILRREGYHPATQLIVMGKK